MIRYIMMCLLLLTALIAGAQSSPDVVSTSQLTAEITSFLSREVAVHVADIHTLEPPQDRVLGAKNGGEFSWGTFSRAVAATSALSGETSFAGRDLAKFIGQVGLIEARHDGKSFAQMYATLALRQFGTDLQRNAVWQSLSPSEQQEWRSLLDPARFYDRAKRNVINLPENYLGVASRLVTMDYQMGIITDRVFVDDVVNRAAEQFVNGALYSDDSVPTGRFDRYSQEYARYVYEAAENAGRKDVMTALEPSLKAQMRLWWDLLSEDGYGYPWGRSLGAISYMDTMEIAGFLAQHPQLRPASLAQLGAAYNAAWRWLEKDFLPERHLLNVFGFGRGNYSYINPDREWQQTTAFFGKIANANALFMAAAHLENLTTVPSKPELPTVARFEYFRKGSRPAGVWLVRQGALRFALPITTGTKPGVADYLPAPHGLFGFAAPVEQTVPALVPYIELTDGRTIIAGDGADQMEPGADGKSLRATWNHWVILGGKPAQFVEPGLSTTVTWRIEGDALIRSETISSSRPLTIRRFSVLFPSTANHFSTTFGGNGRVDHLEGAEGSIELILANSSVPLTALLEATGDGPLGKGSRGAIPLIFRMEATGIVVKPGSAMDWTLRLRPVPKR